MPAQKRSSSDTTSAPKAKKTRLSENKKPTEAAPFKSSLNAEEIDFPRGGGTSLTASEVKILRAEAIKEADTELFEDERKKSKAGKRRKSVSKPTDSVTKSTKTRIEHLNYKRIDVGMKIFGQIVSILPLALIISLPNQLYAHVPVTEISTQYTAALERIEGSNQASSDSEDDEDEETQNRVHDLLDLFRIGQYVRAVVTAVHSAGTTDSFGLSKSRDEIARASRRVELSLVPEKVNEGVQKADLKKGFILTAAVKSIEDHGYTLELGIPDIKGFLLFKDTEKSKQKLPIGTLIDVQVNDISKNGRVCNVNADQSISSSSLSDISNATSILPGALVQCLITGVQPEGLVVQALGFFEGTINQFQLQNHKAKTYEAGKKIKARILYSYSASPPKFALSLSEHVIRLGVRCCGKDKHAISITEKYPIGTIITDAKVDKVEAERGLVLKVDDDQLGFVHISHVSDGHVPTLAPNSGHWRVGTLHQARVTGYFAFDGVLQLSLRQSVIEQKFMQVNDLQVGESVKGTIKSLTDMGLFISLSGSIDGMVKPNHYSDIALKHPAKRFKAGAALKCRVLAVDTTRKRILLTAKKTLLDSTLPIITRIEDATVGLVTHAVVCRTFERHLLVEFYNHVKALIPASELSDNLTDALSTVFPEGRVVKVRVISVDRDKGRIVASVKQLTADPNAPVTDISSVEIGDSVEGVVTDIHKDNAVLLLQPTRVRAIVSLKNLANYRGINVVQLQSELHVDDKLNELLVVSRNPEKAIVVVAHKPKPRAPVPGKNGSLTMDSIIIGQIVGGRVTRHARSGTLVKLNSHLGGIVHPTDVSDDFESCNDPYLAVDSIIKAAVVNIDKDKKQLILSTRRSRMDPKSNVSVVDREIIDISSLTEGDTIRGYIKTVADHGLFVTVGRDIDARVQIKELFDEYVKDWKSRFKAKQVVKGRILKVDAEKKQVEMTFRSNVQKQSTSLTLTDLSDGMKVDGVIKRIEDYGLFIQLSGSRLSGLCHKSELSDNPEADVTSALENLRVGDQVKAFVISVKDKKISFSLKPSHFADDETHVDEDMGSASEDVPQEPDLGVVDDVGSDQEDDIVPDADDVEDDDDDDDEEEGMDVDIALPTFEQKDSSALRNGPQPLLQLGDQFKWFNDDKQPEEGDSDSSHESDDEAEGTRKKKKRKEIQQDLTAEMHERTPSSLADFERVLLGSPDSSFIWIQYMSFQLQLSEVEKARSIGRRALRIINFREEREKMNVWIALLNLENTYGTDDSLDALFKEAARSNDSKTIHLRMASIFDQSGKLEKAKEQYTKTSKKFGQSSKVWTLFAEFYLRHGEAESARQLLPRSLQSLEKHLKTISKFAQLEYKLGDAERGKTIFEGIVDSHPKRWDLWSVYMDMEASEDDIQSLRNLFQRVLALKMSSHKAKSFFKKWLTLEQRLGDEDGQNTVKQKAIKWTTAMMSS